MTVCSVVMCVCCQSVLLVVLAGGLSLVHELYCMQFVMSVSVVSMVSWCFLVLCICWLW